MAMSAQLTTYTNRKDENDDVITYRGTRDEKIFGENAPLAGGIGASAHRAGHRAGFRRDRGGGMRLACDDHEFRRRHHLGRRHYHWCRHQRQRRAQTGQAHPGRSARAHGHTPGLHRGQQQVGRRGQEDGTGGLAERRAAQGHRGRQAGRFRHHALEQLGHLLQQGPGAQAAGHLGVEHHLPGDQPIPMPPASPTSRASPWWCRSRAACPT